MNKITQASSKLISIKKFYFNKLLLFGLISLTSLVFLFIIYLGSYYSFFVDETLVSSIPFIYNKDPSLQNIISLIVGIIVALLGSLIILVLYYINNSKYTLKANEIMLKELELNEIYSINHEKNNEVLKFDKIFAYIGLDVPKYYYLMTLSSLINLNFYQIHDSKYKPKNGLLITSTVNENFDGFLQIRSDNKFTIDSESNKNIYQYYLDDVKRFSNPIYINSTFKKDTYKLVDNEVVTLFLKMKEFCKNNIVITLTNKQLIIYISSWELKLIDPLKKKLYYNSVDLKVEALTELIDFSNDIYYYISKKYKENLVYGSK